MGFNRYMDRIRFYTMIDFAKITGEMEGHRLKIKMPTGESLFAPLLVHGNSTSLPSQVWINENKDNFLAVVTYEGTRCYDSMIIGFYPVKGADSTKYDVTERLLELVMELVEKLSEAKVNTMMGSQPFMPNTLVYLESIHERLNIIHSLIEKNKV